jgi:hypothetical protein
MPSPAITFSWLIFVIAGVLIGLRKGRLAMGIVWSLLIGPVGLVIVALMPKTDERQIAEARQRARVEAAARHTR